MIMSNTSSTITARSLDLSGLTGGNKVYDGTTGAILIGTPTLGNLVAGDLVQIGGQGSTAAQQQGHSRYAESNVSEEEEEE